MSIIKDIATITSLCIDKISITCSVNRESLLVTCNLLNDLMRSNQFPIKITVGRFYRFNCIILIEAAENHRAEKVLLQVGSRRPNASDIRIECNPAKLGPLGIYRLKDILASLELDPGEIFSNATVTRLDVALDIFDLGVDQVIARSNSHRKHAVYSDKNGVPETLYFGTPRSNRTTVYTKQHSSGRKSLRLERRLKLALSLGDVAHIENPFNRLLLINTQALEPYLNDMVATQFFDSVRVRGFSHAVANLPSKQRRALIGVLRDPRCSLLPAMDEMWGGWPDLVSATFDLPGIRFASSPPLVPTDVGHRAHQGSDK